MTDVKEQRILIKFCFKLGKTAAETHKMLKEAFGDNSLGQTQAYEWFKHFKNGRISVDDDERSGRPSTIATTVNVEKVQEVILEDRTRRILDVCNIVGLSYGACRRILSLWTQHAAHCSKIFFQGWWKMIKRNIALLSALSSRNRPKTTPISTPLSLLVTNLGCLGTTLRWSCSRISERLQIHRDRRKHNFGVMSN